MKSSEKKHSTTVYFADFDNLKDILGSIDLVYALIIIRFHCTRKEGPIVNRDGKTWAPHIIDRLRYWMDISSDTARRILERLEAMGIIKTCLYRTYFKTSLHVTVIDLKGMKPPFIDLMAIRKAIKTYGSIEAAFTLFKIHYHSHASKIRDEQGLNYWVSSRKELARWGKIGVKTVDKILAKLIETKSLIKKKLKWCEHSKTHLHIPNAIMKFFQKEHLVDNASLDPSLFGQKGSLYAPNLRKYIPNSNLHKQKMNNYYRKGEVEVDLSKLPAYKPVEFEKKEGSLCNKSFLEALNELKTGGKLNYV